MVKEINENDAVKCVRDLVCSALIGRIDVSNIKFHHSASYTIAPSICENGILSLSELKRRNLIQLSDEKLKLMADNSSHINGIDCVSLSVMGLTDLYKDEFEFDAYDPYNVDFIVSSDIKARRVSTYYGNEFLTESPISHDDIRSIDIRLLKLIGLVEDGKGNIRNQMLVDDYNKLREMALVIRKNDLLVPIREMSIEEIFGLDIDRLSDSPIILIKK